jgi:hypothetical protein
MTSAAIEQQLLNQAKVIAQLRRDLDELTSELTDALASVLGRVEAVENSSPVGVGGSPTSWCWRGLGPAGREELWNQLSDWVRWIRGRYPLARRIPPCWADHPEIVEELTALWLAWVQAYEDRDTPLTAAADWHDRWLPGVLYRLEHGAFALDCGTTHQPRPSTAYATQEKELETC